MRALDKEGWLKVLHPHWTMAKIDASELGQVVKTRQMMSDLGYSVETGPIVMYFLTRRMGDKDISEIQRMIPRRDFVDKWKHLEHGAHDLAKKLTSKEAGTPSGSWKVLTNAAPEDDSVSQPDHQAAGGGPEAEELLREVASGEGQVAVPGNG